MSELTEKTHIFKKFDLSGRVALVTGGAGLLGTEFCRTLAEAGAKIAIADLNTAAVTSLVDSLVYDGYTAIGLETDITDNNAVRTMVSTTLKTFGRLDILVNSAALDPKFDPQHIEFQSYSSEPEHASTFENYPLESWNQALNVNLTGTFLCCQAGVGPMLDQGGGVIINLSSIYGLTGPDQQIYQLPDQPLQYKPVYYTVTKAGILGLTKYLSTYYAGKNIRVNALTPGGVFNDHDETFVRAYSARTVLGRMARKDEMNAALLFLASDASSYMTGSNLIVDGGWTAW
jgi:2-deoxy-D-gluconate 3-dehydrogenase